MAYASAAAMAYAAVALVAYASVAPVAYGAGVVLAAPGEDASAVLSVAPVAAESAVWPAVHSSARRVV
jgi:hypothetical protein